MYYHYFCIRCIAVEVEIGLTLGVLFLKFEFIY